MAYLIGSIIAFSIVVLIHEGGHFLIGKAVGMKINEFSLGMGPKIYSFEKGETQYSVRALPIGGYVKPEGEDADSEDPRAYNNISLIGRTAMVAAGPISNFIFTFLIIMLLITFAGVPLIKIGEVMSGMPAAQAGLHAGDIIKSINGKNIYLYEDLIDTISVSNNTRLIILRSGKELSFNIRPIYSIESGRNIIGILPDVTKTNFYKFSYAENFKNSISYSSTLTWQIGLWLKKTFTTGISKEDVGGPVKIVTIAGEAAKRGFGELMLFTALLSLSLGLFNLFPIPALDGGRLVFFVIEGIRGKPVNQRIEGMVHLVGFILLMILLIFVTYNDITSFF